MNYKHVIFTIEMDCLENQLKHQHNLTLNTRDFPCVNIDMTFVAKFWTATQIPYLDIVLDLVSALLMTKEGADCLRHDRAFVLWKEKTRMLIVT